MKKKILGGFTLALIILIATMAYNRKPSVNELLKQDWRYVSATDLENNILETPDKNSTLSLSNQFTFSNVTSFETGFEKGLWRFKDSTLILTVDYTADIDSVSYIVEANKPMLIYYKDNKEISRVVTELLVTIRKLYVCR